MNTRVQIKKKAREFLRTGQVSPLAVSTIVIVVGMVLSDISFMLYTANPSYMQLLYELGMSDTPEAITLVPIPVANFGIILISLVTALLDVGFFSYLMGIRKGQEMGYSSLLDALSIAGKVIWCSIQIFIRLFLWSILLFIPGIIAAYRYRFAYFNLIEYPELSVSQAIALSCRQTEGRKWDLFALDLSFFGWICVSMLTGGVAGIWVRPYMILSDLGYYEMACAALGTEHREDKDSDPKNDTPWEF